MNKKIKFLLFALILISIVFSLLIFSSNNPIAPSLKINKGLEGITLVLEKNTFPLDTNIIYGTITNNSDFEVITNGAFAIEYFDRNTWRVIPFRNNFLWGDIAIHTESKNSKNVDFPLELFEINKAGLYRVRTTFSPLSSSDSSHDVIATFYLE